MGFPGGTVVKHAGDASSIPGSGRSPGEGNGNLPSILAWKIPWTEELVRQQSIGCRVGHTLLSHFSRVRLCETP